MKQVRNSSFELLRIILMIMVLIEHGNMWFIGTSYQTIAEHWGRSIIQSICIGAVNGFVLISGWFGIKNGISKIGSILFMLLFCTIPITSLALLYGKISSSELFSLDGIYQYVLGGNNYWFVVDYIGLLIIAKILNRGIFDLSKKEFSRVLIIGYVLISVYDFILRTTVLGIEGGYSVLWFGYLYLLARYMRINGMHFINKYRWSLFICSIVVQSILFYNGLIGLRYTNPLILLAALSLIFIFRKWNFRSKIINHAARGALMAYLIHMHPVAVPYISNILFKIYVVHGYWIYMVEVLVLSCIVYIFAIGMNKIQSILFKKLSSCW